MSGQEPISGRLSRLYVFGRPISRFFGQFGLLNTFEAGATARLRGSPASSGGSFTGPAPRRRPHRSAIAHGLRHRRLSAYHRDVDLLGRGTLEPPVTWSPRDLAVTRRGGTGPPPA
jgi:hypothetical protein